MTKNGTRSSRTIALAVGGILAFSILSCAAGLGLVIWAGRRVQNVRGAGERTVFEHAELRFRLRRPGPGWRLVEPDDAARLNPDAAAFAIDTPTGSTAVVIVEPAYGADLERAGAAVRRSYAILGTELGEWEQWHVSGEPALRATGRGASTGVSLRIGVAVLVHQDHLYQLYCTATEGRADQAPLDAAIGAFELLEGPVVLDRRPMATEDGEGPLWRVQDHVAESAVGLRVRGDETWGVLAGTELERIDALADLGITREAPAVSITVTASMLRGAVPELVRARLHEETALELGGDPAALSAPVERAVAGRSVPFVRFRTEDGIGIDHAYGVLLDGERVFQILAWSPAPGALEAHLAEGLARVELTTTDEQRALERATAETRSDAIGPGAALRNGTFRAYDDALRWRAPSPCWRGFLGAAASVREPDARLVVECPRLAIRGALWTAALDAPVDASSEHDLATDSLFGPPPEEEPGEASAPTEARFGAVAGLASSGAYEVDGAAFAYRLLTVERAGTAIRWAVWYPRASAPEAEREADAAFRAMTVDPRSPPAQTSEPGFIEDRRLGISFEDRTTGLRFADETLPAWTNVGRLVTGHGSGTSVTIFAFHTSGLDSSGVAMDAVQDRVLSTRRSLLAPPEHSPGTLGGQPCRVLRWTEGGRRVSLRIAQRGGVVAGLVTETGFFSDGEQRLVEAFRFVDP